jgi:hypothetical protein
MNSIKKYIGVTVLTAFIVAVSYITYLYIDYNASNFSFELGAIVLETNWIPLIIHLAISAVFLAFCLVFHTKIIAFVLNKIMVPFYQNFLKVKFHDLLAFFRSPPRFRLSIKQLGLILLIFAIPLFQVHSIWDFFGERVDENALFHFAIGYFGGNFDPGWYGYGSLGMYILYSVYMLLALPMIAIGKFGSLDEYTMQVFYNGYFVLVARYLFAVFGVIAVIILARTARYKDVPIVLIILFALISITSHDAIHFANYLRTDLLVGFFVALSIHFAFRSNKKKYLYLLAITIAGAISTKISSFPMVVLLIAYIMYRAYDKTIKWHHVIGVLFTFIISLIVFQPYVNHIESISSIFKIGVKGIGGAEAASSFQWGKVYYYTYTDRLIAIYQIFYKYCGLPIVLSFFLLVFSKRYIKIVIPSLLSLFLLIIPYINSPEITYYWFLPAFNVVRLLSLLAIAGVVYNLALLSKKIKPDLQRSVEKVVIAGIVIISAYFIIYPNLQNYIKKYNWKETNKVLAQKWVEKNLIENEYILLEGNVDYLIPQFYNRKSIKVSKAISRAFLHNRGSNEYLNKLFENYLENYYYERIEVDLVKGIRQIKKIDIMNSDQVNELYGRYYITSPTIYRRFLNRSSVDLPADRRKQLEDMQAYFRFMISNPLHKRFNSGRGSVIEIYHITTTFDEYHSNLHKDN